jgi:hypothetical protein
VSSLRREASGKVLGTLASDTAQASNACTKSVAAASSSPPATRLGKRLAGVTESIIGVSFLDAIKRARRLAV